MQSLVERTSSEIESLCFLYIVVHRLYTVTLRIGGVFQWSNLSCYSACICNTLKVALSDRSRLRLQGFFVCFLFFYICCRHMPDEQTRQDRGGGGETYLAYGSVGVGATWVQIQSRSALPVAHVLIQSTVVLLLCCQRRIPTPPLSHRSWRRVSSQILNVLKRTARVFACVCSAPACCFHPGSFACSPLIAHS